MFLRIAALLFASLLIGSVHAASPADNFVKPVTSRVAISPSGKYVAVITAIGHDKKALAIAPFENGKIGKFKGTNLGEMLVSDVIFKTDDRLIVTVVTPSSAASSVCRRPSLARARLMSQSISKL